MYDSPDNFFYYEAKELNKVKQKQTTSPKKIEKRKRKREKRAKLVFINFFKDVLSYH